MKLIRKVFTVIMVVLMLLNLSVAAFATDTQANVTLTIEGFKTNHNYKAYQIFSGTIVNGVLQGIAWGEGVDRAGLAEELKKNSLFANIETTDAVQVANIISGWASNSDQLDDFADLVGKHLVENKAVLSSPVSNSNNYSFSLKPGYYLIKDVPQSANEELVDDFYTKFMITLTSSTTAKVKGSIPTVDKKVSHNLANNYSDVITDQLGKTHYYQWIGTISSDIEDYDEYYYSFTDTMSDGLTFLRIEQIFIQHVGDVKTEIYDVSKDNPETDATDEGVLDRNLMPTRQIDGNTITVTWRDLKSVYPSLLPSDKIYIRYSAKLNQNAVIGGVGNRNEVELRYSNEPNGNSHGKTQPDDSRVYSFELEVLKQDEISKNKLENVEFVLFHYHTQGDKNVPMYANVDASGKLTGWTATKNDATTLKTNAEGKLKVIGIQANMDYYLEETKALTGYTALSEPVEIIIDSYTLGADKTITSITYEVASDAPTTVNGDVAATGKISVTVNNKSGTTLPSTGGMGTTLFYLVGGALVLGAVVLLVTKKRMSGEK